MSKSGWWTAAHAGIDNMTQVIAGLLDSGEFEQVLQRLDDE
ncbi:hypothetical protein ACFYU4_12260 [Streptomyces tendae]